MYARDAQWAPTELPGGAPWDYWLLLAGRGFGKTRCGAETIKRIVADWDEGGSDEILRIGLIAPTVAEARDIMVEGESGILSIYPLGCAPKYEPSKRRITWYAARDPKRVVAIGYVYSADKPERLRGHQHHVIWADELAAWRYKEAWDQALFGLRLGEHPIAIITTTPKPKTIIRELVRNPNTYVTKGSTYDNIGNLASSYIERVIKPFEGTTLGRQEIDAELMDELPNALWTRHVIEDTRIHIPNDAERFAFAKSMERIVIGVDPPVTGKEGSNDCGIVPVGKRSGHGYTLGDHTMHGSSHDWAKAVVRAFNMYEANCVVAEVNQGGDLVEEAIAAIDPAIPVRQVRAVRGKYKRAEPISLMWEKGNAHIVGLYPDLEDQMCCFVNDGVEMDDPKDSPDNTDAMVWAYHELFVGSAEAGAWGTGRDRLTSGLSNRGTVH